MIYGLSIPFTHLLSSIGPIQKVLGATTYTPGDLRWAFFAIALIIVMLVRPQGMFGHHEFSWDWVKSLFGIKHKETAVAVAA
jgi:branched-chain amino acid transport system permease protein